MVERLRVQLPGPIDLGTGHLPEALGILLHEHAIIQNARCMDDAAKPGRHCKHPANVIGFAYVCGNNVDFDTGVFQGMQHRALVVGGNATAPGEHKVPGTAGCKVLILLDLQQKRRVQSTMPNSQSSPSVMRQWTKRHPY